MHNIQCPWTKLLSGFHLLVLHMGDGYLHAYHDLHNIWYGGNNKNSHLLTNEIYRIQDFVFLRLGFLFLILYHSNPPSSLQFLFCPYFILSVHQMEGLLCLIGDEHRVTRVPVGESTRGIFPKGLSLWSSTKFWRNFTNSRYDVLNGPLPSDSPR